ncbi:MAG: C40 family peptidase [Alphaproteobacteria bacterium]
MTTDTNSSPAKTHDLDPRLHAYRSDLADIALKDQVIAAEYTAGAPMIVADATTPVRRKPRSDAALDTEALRGEVVTVFERTDEGWAWGQLQRDRYVGWLPSDALIAGDEGSKPVVPTHRVSVPRTLVFPGPDIKMPPLEALPLGAEISVSATAPGPDTGFARVASAGFVPIGHLTPLAGMSDAARAAGYSAPATDFVAVAEQFVGTPYLWGGKTSLGLDCSGLAQIALMACGYNAPRDTDMQAAALGSALDPATDRNSLRRGDLVFWRGHVGIMQDAANILHANAHHMAVTSEKLTDVLSRIGKKGLDIIGLRRIV